MKKSIVSCAAAICMLIIIIVTATAASNGGTIDFLKKRTEQGELIMSGDLLKSIKTSMEYNTSFEKLPTYSYDDFMLQVSFRKPSSYEKILPMTSFGMNDLYSFNELFPMKRINIINDDCICAEYKLNKDGRFIHTFVVFERAEGTTDNKKRFESWMYYGELYFAYPELNTDDLAALKGNQELASLPFNIDMSATVYLSDAADQKNLHSEETIMLKDGFAIIDYIADAPDSKNVSISDITVVKYGETDKDYPYNSLIKNGFIPEIIP